ncbi:alpha/beta-hydrolase [Eremomyces bilateralis CBS 781.70]|uniref:Alpha/beta-hydrolase n=1 Tax=Eremomyces bilateralis CBS 781.70 TaxID=1392243 RepID=A0A6G1G1F5_9PEZI|nr:alpha/beta-hydrolase [Eremomyces bilateralis CBS 781.70]KAF1811884.1 alpha/beta-hydrolase [Eremomyces bilateralis CBS 781.70]
MSTPKPTIILVHGAFHGPWCFSPLSHSLRAKSLPCIDDLALPSAGSARPLQVDVEALRAVLHQVIDKDGNDCVLVMHSYGGVVGGEAIRGFGVKDRGAGPCVRRTVYIATSLPVVGQSHWELTAEWAAKSGVDMGSVAEIRDDGEVAWIASPEMFYNGLPKEKQEEMSGKLKTQSVAALGTPVEYAGHSDSPGWFLMCTKDLVVSLAQQKYIVALPGVDIERSEEIETGHTPFLTHPDEVADFIARAAEV